MEERGRLHCRRWSSEDQLASSRRCRRQRFISKASRLKPAVAHIYEYTTQVRLTRLGFPTILGLLQFPSPIEQFPLPVLQHVWTHPSTQHLGLLQVAMPTPSSVYHLWKGLDINSSIGRACGEFVAFESPWSARSALWKSPFFDAVLDNAVAAQNFEYKMSNNPDNL